MPQPVRYCHSHSSRAHTSHSYIIYVTYVLVLVRKQNKVFLNISFRLIIGDISDN